MGVQVHPLHPLATPMLATYTVYLYYQQKSVESTVVSQQMYCILDELTTLLHSVPMTTGRTLPPRYGALAAQCARDTLGSLTCYDKPLRRM